MKHEMCEFFLFIGDFKDASRGNFQMHFQRFILRILCRLNCMNEIIILAAPEDYFRTHSISQSKALRQV